MHTSVARKKLHASCHVTFDACASGRGTVPIGCPSFIGG
jgi:hypothetical protein